MEELPSFSKVQNGHAMEIFPAQGESGEFEEIVFWCHTCDPNGVNAITLPALPELAPSAYYYLLDKGEEHAQQAPIV